MDDAVPASHRAWWLLLAVALLLLAAVYVSTLRTGQPWGGDNAMYLLHARNLVDGTPYANTGYLYNAASGRFPISYPPVFPLLLTPLLASFGVAWTPLKLATIACFIAGLALLAAHERSRLRRPELLGFILLVGLNPVLWNFKDNVLSEYPFLMFLAAALYLADRPREPSTPRNRVARGLLFGALCYLAYGTRSVGALLIPAFVAAEAIRGQRIDASHGAAAAAFASLAGLQNALLHSETGHLIYKLGRLEPTVPLENLFVQFPSLFHAFWASGSPLEAMGILLALAAAALISFGLWGRLRSRRFDTTDARIRELGEIFRAGDLKPPPLQQPIPLWAGYMGPKGARRAGRLGVGLLSLSRDLAAPYLSGLEEAGHSVDLARMGGLLRIVCADDPERAFPEIVPHIAHQQNSYTRAMYAGSGKRAPEISEARILEAGRRGERVAFQVLDVREAAEFILASTAGLPVEHAYLWASVAGMPDALVERHVELSCGPLRDALRDGAEAPADP